MSGTSMFHRLIRQTDENGTFAMPGKSDSNAAPKNVFKDLTNHKKALQQPSQSKSAKAAPQKSSPFLFPSNLAPIDPISSGCGVEEDHLERFWAKEETEEMLGRLLDVKFQDFYDNWDELEFPLPKRCSSLESLPDSSGFSSFLEVPREEMMEEFMPPEVPDDDGYDEMGSFDITPPFFDGLESLSSPISAPPMFFEY